MSQALTNHYKYTISLINRSEVELFICNVVNPFKHK